MSTMNTRSGTKKAPATKKKPPKPKQPTVNARLLKIEEALDKVASFQATLIPEQAVEPPHTSTRGRKPKKATVTPATQRRSLSLDLPSTSHQLQDNGCFYEIQHEFTPQQGNSDHASTRDVSRRRPSETANHAPACSTDLEWNVRRDLQTHNVAPVNINNPWKAWFEETKRSNTSLDTGSFRPQHPSINNQDDVEAQVQHILATTAHSLSKGNNKPEQYPFKYVARGPERKKLLINTVTLAEHLWGILRMIKDEKTDKNVVPYLLKHLEDVIEDACDFDWSRVRRWSEEIFSLVAEKRLEDGWKSQNRIQMLRMNISRTEAAALYQSFHYVKDPLYKRSAQQGPTSDPPRGGPPCVAYNSPAGCPLQPGHVVNGRKVSHICTFCLFNSSAAYTHPEAQCRNKLRFPPPSHFQ